MNQREAYSLGKDQGDSAARFCEISDIDRREAGCGCVEGKMCIDCLSQAAYESELNARQFSPWEFIAHDINECGDRAENLWEAYGRGIGIGIRKAARRRLREV